MQNDVTKPREIVCCVYLLSDPRNNLPKYIGATKDLISRIKNYNKTSGHSKQLKLWMAELLLSGNEPLISILEVCEEYQLDSKELKWYNHYSKEYKLLNSLKPSIDMRASSAKDRRAFGRAKLSH
jgi:hypothetical protein